MVIPLKYKKGIRIINALQKILDKSYCKPSKIWVDKGSEFYSRSMKSLLQDSNIEMYSVHKEEKNVVAQNFITNLKKKNINT